MTTYFGSRVEAIPAWNTAHRVHADPADALEGQYVRGRVVRGRAFSGHAARAGAVADALRHGPPPGWASARVVDRACARRGLALDK